VSKFKILSGGAAQGLVARIAPKFEAVTGWSIDGEFGAVGTMAAKLRSGVTADLIILTAAIVGELDREGFVVAGSIRPVGLVETALAVRSQDSMAPVAAAAALRRAFLAAEAIFVPDITASTAGIHVMTVLNRLGIADQVRPQLKIFPNGATAMRSLAASDAVHPIGCTQSTEIIGSPGLKLVGPLPDEFALKTIYSAAIAAKAADVAIATAFVDLLAGAEQLPLRIKAGFLET